MKIEIEDYKTHTIFYDEDSDKFICDISIEDNFKKSSRKSLKEVRKEIDQFIRDNVGFKPIKAIKVAWNDITVLELSALRSDKTILVKGEYRDSYYKKKDCEELFKYDPDVIDEYSKLVEENKKINEEFKTKCKNLHSKLVKLDLSHLDLQ